MNYTDYQVLLTTYNFTGIATGTTAIFGAPVSQSDGKYVITYTVFENADDVVNSGYYSQSVINSFATTTYKNNVEAAFTSIMHGSFPNYMSGNFDDYSVLFQDVANIAFDTAYNSTGYIALGQTTQSLLIEEGIGISTSAFVDIGSNQDTYGDIWINTEHDSIPVLPGGFNVWDINSQINPGTAAFKVLLEETMHALGGDILGPTGNPKNTNLDSHKYTITSYNSHPGMDYDGLGSSYFLGNATGPFPLGLQLFDIATLQEIYGRNYETRSSETAYSKAGAFASSLDDESFVYTIWDGGGTDSIFTYDYTGPVKIDLRQGYFSSIGNDGSGQNGFAFTPNGSAGITVQKDIENVAVAFHTIIENASGTQAGDVLIGNAWNNILRGEGGNDFLFGDGEVFNGEDGFRG